MPQIMVSSAAELSDALAGASGGDEILLNDGNYGSFQFTNLRFQSYVDVRPAAGADRVSFDQIEIANSQYLRIDGVDVSYPTNLTGNAGSVLSINSGSRHIEILDSNIHGKIDGNYQYGRGVEVEDSADVLLKDNFIHNVANGGVFLSVQDIAVIGNQVEDIRSDMFKFAGIEGGVIEDNIGPSRYHAYDGDHRDFIQFQGTSNDIVIRGNVVLPALEARYQGIFMGTSGNKYNNILVEDNIIVNDLNRAISIGAGSNITVRNNTVLSAPGDNLADYGSAKAALILVPSGSTVVNNVSSSYASAATIGANIVAQHTNPNGTAYYGDLYQNATKGLGLTIEDLRPVAGSPVDFGSGMGAERRIAELLGADNAMSGNVAPSAADDTVSVMEDGVVEIDALANDGDADGDRIEVTAVGEPAHGTAGLNPDDSITYTPGDNFFGDDSFSYTIRDAKGGVDSAIVSVTVSAVGDDAPVATDDEVETPAGTATAVDVLANDSDPDGDPLTVANHTRPANGTLADLGGDGFRYTPNPGFVGTDGFSYTIGDGTGRSDTATVSVDVLAAGSGATDSGATDSGATDSGATDSLPKAVFSEGANTFSGSRADAVVLAHDAAHEIATGTLELAFMAETLARRQGLFTKDASHFGTGGHLAVLLEGDDVRVRLQDTRSSHEIRARDVVEAGRDHRLALTFGPDGMALWLDGEKVGANGFTGGLEGNAEPIVVGANQWGSSDGSADRVQDAFEGTIEWVNLYAQVLTEERIKLLAAERGDAGTETAPNAAPAASDDTATVRAGEAVTIDVLANDGDPDGDRLVIVETTAPAHGDLVDAGDGALTYTPVAGFAGQDRFTYTVTDGVLSDTAVVDVTVTEAPAENEASRAEPVFAMLGTKTYDGTRGDVAVIAHAPAFELDAGTISFAFTVEDASRRQGLVSKDAKWNGDGGHFSAYVVDSTLIVRFQDRVGEATLQQDGIEPGRTYAVDAVFGDDGVLAYIDGELFGQSTAVDAGWTSNREVLQVGALGWASAAGDDSFSNPLRGSITDLEIYDQDFGLV